MPPRSIEVYDHAGDQGRAFGNLLKIGDYSVLVIICGQARHKVHKAIICPQSAFFKAACDSIFKEAQTGEIELPDDDPVPVRMMIEYLYDQTYAIPYDAKLVSEYQRSPTVRSKPSTAPLDRARHTLSGDSPATQSLLHPLQTTDAPIPPLEAVALYLIDPYVIISVHYRVYELGEKYGIAGLKALAVHNFETEVEGLFGGNCVRNLGDLIHVMREVYACTAEGDRPLRDAVVRILKSKPILFEREDVKKFLKEEGLAYDMVMSCVQDVLKRKEDDCSQFL
ncbi:kelch 4 [Fusarium sp. NRRL 52700]|nr:kelch 4 [Fusarium sp. NRRL 52700]